MSMHYSPYAMLSAAERDRDLVRSSSASEEEDDGLWLFAVTPLISVLFVAMCSCGFEDTVAGVVEAARRESDAAPPDCSSSSSSSASRRSIISEPSDVAACFLEFETRVATLGLAPRS